MKRYHVIVEQAEEGWLAARAREDASVHTQGRTFDEIIRNIREVAELLTGETQIQIELDVPSDIRVA